LFCLILDTCPAFKAGSKNQTKKINLCALCALERQKGAPLVRDPPEADKSPLCYDGREINWSIVIPLTVKLVPVLLPEKVT
jgi:hypothetical protein